MSRAASRVAHGIWEQCCEVLHLSIVKERLTSHPRSTQKLLPVRIPVPARGEVRAVKSPVGGDEDLQLMLGVGSRALRMQCSKLAWILSLRRKSSSDKSKSHSAPLTHLTYLPERMETEWILPREEYE